MEEAFVEMYLAWSVGAACIGYHRGPIEQQGVPPVYHRGQYENVAVLIAIAVNEDGYREALSAAEGMKGTKLVGPILPMTAKAFPGRG